jgi:hypothetical protein
MTEQVQATNITLNDFIVVVNIIDACSQRGSFKGDELSAVGQLRDKFATFIKENTPATEEPATKEVTE